MRCVLRFGLLGVLVLSDQGSRVSRKITKMVKNASAVCMSLALQLVVLLLTSLFEVQNGTGIGPEFFRYLESWKVPVFYWFSASGNSASQWRLGSLWRSILGTLFPTACHHDSTECINTQYYLRWAVESERTAKAGDFDVAETHGFVVVLLIYLHIYVTRIVWFPVVTIIIVTVCYRSNSLLSWSWHKRSIVWKT